ncbi:hypothetical protein ABK040_007755 [Willaertia magna]
MSNSSNEQLPNDRALNEKYIGNSSDSCIKDEQQVVSSESLKEEYKDSCDKEKSVIKPVLCVSTIINDDDDDDKESIDYGLDEELDHQLEVLYEYDKEEEKREQEMIELTQQLEKYEDAIVISDEDDDDGIDRLLLLEKDDHLRNKRNKEGTSSFEAFKKRKM